MEELMNKHKNMRNLSYSALSDCFEFATHIHGTTTGIKEFCCIVSYRNYAQPGFSKVDDTLTSVTCHNEEEFFNQIEAIASTLAQPHGEDAIRKETQTELEV
jgi:hypothetical protein